MSEEDGGKILQSFLFECMDCSSQWMSKNDSTSNEFCGFCLSRNTQRVCSWTEQLHLFSHEDVDC